MGFLRLRKHTVVVVTIFCSIFITFYGHLANAIEADKLPESQTILVGGFVQFECNILEPVGLNKTLQWYIEWDDDAQPSLLDASVKGSIDKSDRPEFNGRGIYQTQYFVSTTIQGYNNHNCILVIHSATLKDNGYIGCSYQMQGGEPFLFGANPARLTIVPQPVKNPECNVNKHQDVFILTCVSYHGNPQAHLTWYEGAQEKSQAIQTFNSLEEPIRNDNVERIILCKARQGNVDVGTCSVTLIGQTGIVDNGLIPVIVTATSTTMKTRNGNKNTNAGGIVAGVLVVIVFVALVVLLLFWYKRTRDKTDKSSPNLERSPHISEHTTTSAPQNQDDMLPYGVYEATSTLSHSGSHVYETADEPAKSSNQADNLYVVHYVNNV